MKCPGQDTQYWAPGAIFEADCPRCAKPVEFFKDDTTRKCSHCGHRFLNPRLDFGCATYCQFAEQCVGNLPPELLAQKEDLLKDRVAIEMKRYFKTDFRQIGHASRVARYAERIGKTEKGNLAVILAAAYLHDIGKVEAGKKFGPAAAEHHEAEGSEVARAILTKLGAREEMIDAVCEIIAHHHQPQHTEDIDFKVVYDADLLDRLDQKRKNQPEIRGTWTDKMETDFLTESGRREAREILAA
jgi:putative nucleotidyltransferase with HDIG domain